jgi:hypothetical protein
MGGLVISWFPQQGSVLLVAACTTRPKPAAAVERKTRVTAQTVGCCYAKEALDTQLLQKNVLSKQGKSVCESIFDAVKTHNVLLGTATKYTHGDLCD